MSAKTKTKSKTPEPVKRPITRADIEAKFGELRGEVDERTQAAKVPAIAIAAGVVALTIVSAYWFGKRKGKKRQMVLEIRRV
ncbi:MAG TPA: hypothetical protein VGP92_04495 [Acidimicrobiia bacterium]|nr:hypothetical protein [Acidimicrobiia bacterium]